MVNQISGGLVNDFLRRVFNELSSTRVAFEPLFTVMNMTILDDLRGHTTWAGCHGSRKAKTLLLHHYMLSTTKIHNWIMNRKVF